MGKIKVIKKVPGERPYTTYISDRLEVWQQNVGGPIEVFPVATDLIIICNEEGRLCNMRWNCNVIGEDLYGPVIFAGRKDDQFTDIPIDFKTFKKVFSGLYK